jgi:hypothetical protein
MRRPPPSRAAAADRDESATGRNDTPRPRIHGPLETPEAIANEPAPFPEKTEAAPEETGFPDWRRRLASNLARRSDGRWAPLTWTHPVEPPTEPPTD